jgi:hypothetical protein
MNNWKMVQMQLMEAAAGGPGGEAVGDHALTSEQLRTKMMQSYELARE